MTPLKSQYMALYLEQTSNHKFCPRYLLSSTNTRSDKMRRLLHHHHRLLRDMLNVTRIG